MSDHIFNLINSLDRKEKAHFTKYAGMSRSEPKFLQLYQAINKMEKYDEVKLRKKFRQSFDSLKSDLHGKLLEALADFHKANAGSSSVHYALGLLPVLLGKKLKHHFEQVLKKAQKQAEEKENWSALYELLDWEKEYLFKSIDSKGLAEKFEKVYEKQNHCIATQEQETYWQNMYLQLNMILRDDHRLLKKGNLNRFEQIGNVPEVDAEKLPSIKAQFYYHRSRNIYYRSVGQAPKALKHAKRIVDVLESKEPDSKRYVDALCSLSRVYSKLGEFEEQGAIIDRLKQLPQLKDGDIILFEKTCQIRVTYYLNTFQFEELAHLTNTIYDRWEDIKKHLNAHLQQGYCYNFIITYWILADYSKALFWMAMILDYKFTTEGKNYLMGARLLELMIYYDHKPAELDNRLDSVRHVLREHWELSQYEKTVFTFFNQLIRKPESEHVSIFKDFYTTLKPYTKERLIVSNEMMYWCQTKLENKTLRTIVEQTA